MFGSTPSIFCNKKAAILAAKAYQKEENVYWTIIEKKDDRLIWYKPCRIKDYTYNVKSEGWIITE